MFITEGKTVREIALEAPATTRIFEQYKIDYCCHGDTLFNEACINVGASPDVVNEKLDAVTDTTDDREFGSYSETPLTELVEYILDKHHVYTKDEISQLMPLMAKVASRHGEHKPYLFELKDLFQAVCDDLTPHMMKEEMVLFPYIQKLDNSHKHNLTVAFPPFGTVQHPVKMMTVEHEEVGEILAKMREITNDYALPEGACPSFTALYHRLEALERDLHQHIHLENNVLFPRAIKLEKLAFSVAV